MITLEVEEVMVKPLKRLKVGHKIFKKAEDVSRFEEVRVKSCGTTKYSKRKDKR